MFTFHCLLDAFRRWAAAAVECQVKRTRFVSGSTEQPHTDFGRWSAGSEPHGRTGFMPTHCPGRCVRRRVSPTRFQRAIRGDCTNLLYFNRDRLFFGASAGR